jgi:hypothetical protein
MVCFQAKHTDLGKFFRALEWKMFRLVCGTLEYFTAIWYILWPFGNVAAILYISPVLVYCVKKNLATLVRTRFSSHL